MSDDEGKTYRTVDFPFDADNMHFHVIAAERGVGEIVGVSLDNSTAPWTTLFHSRDSGSIRFVEVLPYVHALGTTGLAGRTDVETSLG